MTKADSKRLKGKRIRRALELSVRQEVVGNKVTGKKLSNIGWGSGLPRPNNPNSSAKRKKSTARIERDRAERKKTKGCSWYVRSFPTLTREQIEEGKKFLEKHPPRLTRP